MAKAWFTSDLHLGHEACIRFCERPFSNADEMNKRIIAKINEKVHHNDTLYILGDFAFRISREEQIELRRKIACRHVRLVPGNHDRDWSGEEFAGVFEVCPPIHQIALDGHRVVLCHFPIEDWPGLGRGSIHLHGHIHSMGAAYNDRQTASGRLRMDVGVDANGFAPVSWDEVLKRFEGVQNAHRAVHGMPHESAAPPRMGFEKAIESLAGKLGDAEAAALRGCAAGEAARVAGSLGCELAIVPAGEALPAGSVRICEGDGDCALG